jgi:hypothetical protein
MTQMQADTVPEVEIDPRPNFQQAIGCADMPQGLVELSFAGLVVPIVGLKLVIEVAVAQGIAWMIKAISALVAPVEGKLLWPGAEKRRDVNPEQGLVLPYDPGNVDLLDEGNVVPPSDGAPN